MQISISILSEEETVMSLKENKVLVMEYIGEDFCSMPVHRDQFKRFWKA